MTSSNPALILGDGYVLISVREEDDELEFSNASQKMKKNEYLA